MSVSSSERASTASDPLARRDRRRTRVGLVAGGLGAYWPQFPDLLPQLQAVAPRGCRSGSRRLDCEVIDVGFISDAQEGAARGREAAAGRLRPDRRVPDHLHDRVDAGADRAAQRRAGAADQPAAHRGDGPRDLRHRRVARLLRRVSAAGDGQRVPAVRDRRSGRCPVTSRTSAPGQRIERWIKAADVRAALRHGRHGLMGHLYPGCWTSPPTSTLGLGAVRRARRDPRVRRPAGAGGAGHRRPRSTSGWSSPARSSRSTTR